MEAITFTIANELAAIPVVQAASAVYCRGVGACEDEVAKTELVIEEVLVAIMEHEYLPGQKARISLTLSLTDDVLMLLIRFQGIPLDIEQLLRWEKASPLEIIADEDNGMNFRLINWFSDDIEYRNRGWQGQEIQIRRLLQGLEEKDGAARGGIRRVELPVTALLRIGVRRMRPDEATAVSRLAYFSYGYTYFNEYLYQPEEVRERNEDGRLVSYVAVNEEDGAIVGHLAMIPDDLSGMTELGAGFVNPRYRQSGAFQILAKTISGELREQGAPGTFGTAVTSHPYSQRTVIPLGWKETALFVSRIRAMTFQAITDREAFRESLMYMIRLFDSPPRRPYYVPERHCAMIAAIAENAGLAASFAACPPAAGLPESRRAGDPWVLEEKTDANRTAHIVLRRYGEGGIPRLRAVVRRYGLDRMETIYLYLPLFDPATAHFCPLCEEIGFFFAGIKPGSDGADWLVLQYLNNQRYDYNLLQAATSFGREIIAYVQNCDPVVAGAV